jgi:hypothetical protein
MTGRSIPNSITTNRWISENRLNQNHHNPEEVVVLSRLFGIGGFVPKSEAGKELIPTISRLLREECQAKATTA